ncbi:MAG: hypothetical protein J3Q66DRAFT_373645 [Benniella sp.]|nr:MAG: hypothetical protein J3Q66DRAFT_373645 [Benniella sp.]
MFLSSLVQLAILTTSSTIEWLWRYNENTPFGVVEDFNIERAPRSPCLNGENGKPWKGIDSSVAYSSRLPSATEMKLIRYEDNPYSMTWSIRTPSGGVATPSAEEQVRLKVSFLQELWPP